MPETANKNMPLKPESRLTSHREGRAIPRIEVEAILGPGREAVLVHNGEAYTLRVTANNKLILTK